MRARCWAWPIRAPLRRLVEYVADGAAEGLQLIHDLVEAGADLRQLTAQLAEEWRALCLPAPAPMSPD